MKRFLSLLCVFSLFASLGLSFALPTVATEQDAALFTNLYDPDTARNGVAANDGSMQNTGANGFRYKTSAELTVTAGETIYFGPSNPEQTKHLGYGSGDLANWPAVSELTLIDTFDNGQAIYSYKVPISGKFVVCNDIAYDDYFVITKNEELTEEKFYEDIAARGGNLYVKALGFWGSFWDPATNAPITWATHNSTYAIPVTEGDTVAFGPAWTDQNFHGTSFDSKMNIVDDKIQKGELTQNAAFSDGTAIYTYTVPAGVSYVRILNRTEYRDQFYVAKNNVFDVAEYYTLKGIDTESPLFGKSALYLGDSICNGADDCVYYFNSSNRALRGTWGNRLAAKYAMTYVKAGKSGASLSTSKTNRIITQIGTYADQDFDYVILHGGVNDAWTDAPIGTVSDSFDPASFDISTYAGALEELIYNALKTYGDKAAIGYIINFLSPNHEQSGDSAPYFEMGRKVCEKWGISYLDLATEEFSDVMQVTSYDHLPDGIHPNSDGHDLIAPYVAAWMETLKPYTGLINLYDRTKAQDGFYNTNGTLQDDSRYLSAEKITVAAGDVLYFGPADASQSFQLIYWDEDGNSTKVGKNHTQTGWKLVDTLEDGTVIYSYAVPGAGTVGTVLNVNNDETFLITKNQAFDAEALAAYWESSGKEEPALQESVLNGKSALFAGDSICYGSRDTAGLSGWAGRIGKYYQLSYYTNVGKSGNSLSHSREVNPRDLIKWQITPQAGYHYDYVILHGGVNDAWDKVAVGEMTDSFELKDFDTKTFAGGLEELFYYATKYYESSAIGYLINFKLGSTKGNLADMSAYVAEAIKICDKWGVPYFDMYNHEEITAQLQITTTTHSTDGIHPAPSGYDILYPYIAEWMETLEPYFTGKAEVHQNHVIACVGDSITKGEQSTDINRYSYPEYLQNMLGDGYDVLNFGWGGATAQETTSNPYCKTMQYKQSLLCDPDTVIVMLGTNDAKADNWDTADPTAAKAKFKADLKKLVSKYQSLPSKPTVYLASPARLEDESHAYNAVFDNGMVAAVKEVAEELKCTYIDINGLTKDINNDYYADDGCHLINAGYEVLAGHMYQALTGKAYVAPAASTVAETNPDMPLMRNYAQYPDATQYRLETVEDVEKFGDLISSGVTFAGKTVQLMNDLDFSDHHFRPLGYASGTKTPDYTRTFQGTFEGDYHTLSNINITFMYIGVALFPATKGAVIRNLGIQGGCIKGNDVIASVVAYGDYGTQISNVWSSAELFAANSTGNDGSGGIAGNLRKQDDRIPKMTNVAYYGTITGANANGLCAWGQAVLQAETCVFAGQIEHLGKGSESTAFVRYNNTSITGLTANFFGLDSIGDGNKTYDDGSRVLLSAEAYTNGEAAYQLNAIEGAVWTVKDGYTIPWGAASTETHKVTLEDAVRYTDYQGRLLQTDGMEASRFWKDAENNAFNRTTLSSYSFGADTALTAVLTGDVDLSGAVNSADIVVVLRHLIGKAQANEILADLNEDTFVTLSDAVTLLRIAAA